MVTTLPLPSTTAPSPIHTGGTVVVQDVTKIYHATDGSEVHALAHVSLALKAGEFVSLVGPSGCGKSTLLRLITGLDHPDAGALFVDDTPITQPSAQRGLVFQDPTLFPWLTVKGNIQAGLIARGGQKLKRQKHADVAAFIHLVGLDGFERSWPHQLSGGMAQRVSLARALVNDPKVLLLDEPLGALDAFTRMRMQDEVLRLWQARGTTMLLVTHDIDEAIYMSDRIVIMSPRPGRIEKVLNVPLSRPRLRSSPEFLELRAAILEMLHFSHKTNLEYLI